MKFTSIYEWKCVFFQCIYNTVRPKMISSGIFFKFNSGNKVQRFETKWNYDVIWMKRSYFFLWLSENEFHRSCDSLYTWLKIILQEKNITVFHFKRSCLTQCVTWCFFVMICEICWFNFFYTLIFLPLKLQMLFGSSQILLENTIIRFCSYQFSFSFHILL